MARGHRAAWTIIADEALRLRAYGRRARHSGSVRGLMAEAADRALEKATEDEKTVYKLRYVDGMSYVMASQEMHVSEKTFYRILTGLVKKVESEIA